MGERHPGPDRRLPADRPGCTGLLCTILGDAAAAKPPLIPYNPAIRPRNRGRRTGRRLDRGPQRVWVTPLQALLVAERAALLSGRDDDFTMIVTIAYTGLRLGEMIGLEREHVRRDEMHVEWQLREIRSTFHRLPPKDDSYRSPNWEPCLPVDLPPFLAELLARQIQAHAAATVRLRRAARRQRTLRLPRPGRRSLPTQQLRPARLPPSLRRPVSPRDGPARPAGHRRRLGVARRPRGHLAAAQPGAGGFTQPPRGRGIQPIAEDAPLTCWLPVKFGLTPHGLRHSHKTWMAEDGIPEILAEQRLGHEVPGMRGLYAHASERMRDDLKHALQARWEESLRARAAIHTHSPVPLLDELLAPFRYRGHQKSEPAAPRETVKQPTTPGDREKMISQIPPNHAESPSQGSRLGLKERASDLVRDQIQRVELRGFEPLTPSMRTRCATGLRYSPKTASQRSKRWGLLRSLVAAGAVRAAGAPPGARHA